MLKKIEHCYCDKCKKEIKNLETVHHEPYQMWLYDLCDDCIGDFIDFENKVDKLKKQWEELEKEYKFGTYLPKDDLENKGE